VIAAIDRAIQLKSTYHIRIINLSLGRRVFESFRTDPLCKAVERAWRAGIFVAVAAGNMGRDRSLGTDGYATIASPGNDPYVMTVGAYNARGTTTRADDQLTTFSSKGPTMVDHVVKPDILAPGNFVVSTRSPTSLLATYTSTLVSTSEYKLSGSGTSADYLRLSGTSMATPMVSAAAALMLQANPALTPDQVKARMMRTACTS
jgi:serine protease AprX